MTFLQAVAMAGGYTRLANRGSVTVTRMVGGKKTNFNLDLKSATSDLNTQPFEILPDDTITVAERIF
jgi:protein involved in polysaccharide export with SLBB domain